MGSPTCPYCMQRADRCACEDPRIVGYENAPPTPPAPADDAGGAAGMRHDCAEIARRGAVAAYEEMTDAGHETSKTHTYADCMEAVGKALDECEAQIRALPLPGATPDADRVPAPGESASQDAVVEAARAAVVRFAVEARNHGTFPVNECGVIDQTSAVYQSYIATLADLWRSVDALTAALRGANGGGVNMEPIRLWRIYCDGWNYTDDEEVSKIGEPIAALTRAEYDALIAQRDGATARAEKAEQERDEAAKHEENAANETAELAQMIYGTASKMGVLHPDASTGAALRAMHNAYDAATARAEKAERERDDARAALDAQIATVLAAHLDAPTDDDRPTEADRRGEDGA